MSALAETFSLLSVGAEKKAILNALKELWPRSKEDLSFLPDCEPLEDGTEQRCAAVLEGTDISVEMLQQKIRWNHISCMMDADMSVESEDNYWGLFGNASFINHSCEPNVVRITLGSLLLIRTLCDISDGAELTMCYSEVEIIRDNVFERRNQFDFDCQCDRCADEYAAAGPRKENCTDSYVSIELDTLTCERPEKRILILDRDLDRFVGISHRDPAQNRTVDVLQLICKVLTVKQVMLERIKMLDLLFSSYMAMGADAPGLLVCLVSSYLTQSWEGQVCLEKLLRFALAAEDFETLLSALRRFACDEKESKYTLDETVLSPLARAICLMMKIDPETAPVSVVPLLELLIE